MTILLFDNKSFFFLLPSEKLFLNSIKKGINILSSERVILQSLYQSNYLTKNKVVFLAHPMLTVVDWLNTFFCIILHKYLIGFTFYLVENVLNLLKCLNEYFT